MSAKNKQSRLVNLLPKEDFERTTLGRILKWALTSFRYIVIFVEFVVIIGFLSRFWLDVQISDLDEEIQQKTALIDSRKAFEKEFRKSQQKLSLIKTITDDANLTSPVLETVVKMLPGDIQLVVFTKKGQHIEIEGAAISENSIASLLNNLSKENRFENVILTKIETNKDSPLIQFIIKGDIKNLINT